MNITRFIYEYYLLATGKAVYIGSAFDISERDAQHCTQPQCPIDYEIARVGRAAFGIRILETLTENSKVAAYVASVPLENQWMDRRGTYRTPGCFNFMRASVKYSSQEHFAASHAASGRARRGLHPSDETRRKRSASLKGHKVSEETRHKISKANSGKVPSEETRRKIGTKSRGNKHGLGYRHSSEARRRMSEARKNIVFSEESLRRRSEATSAANRSRVWTEESRRRIGEKSKGRKHSEEWKQRLREKGCAHLNIPESIAKRSAAMKGKPFTKSHRDALSISSQKDAKKIARMRSLAESQRGVPKPFSPEHRAAHKVAASAATKRMNATHKGDPIWIARAQAMAEGNRRPVVCVETGERFPSVEEAAKSHNSHAPNISRAIRTGKTAKGVRWAYVDSNI